MGKIKWYGNIHNRLEENKNYLKDGIIKEGDYLTEYLWSDRHAYEVTQVINQKHIFIRPLKAIRTDSYGMSDAQEYRYESDNTQREIELMFKYNKWKKVRRYNFKDASDRAKLFVEEGDIKTYEAALAYIFRGMSQKEIDTLKSGKDLLIFDDMNPISFGIADEYYDYSF